MKRFSVPLAAAGMMAALVMVSCAKNTENTGNQSNSGNASSPSAKSEQVVLRVLAGQSTTDAGIEKMIDAALAKKYPNIKLDWECVGWQGIDKLPKVGLRTRHLPSQ